MAYDTQKFAENMTQAAEKMQEVFTELLQHQHDDARLPVNTPMDAAFTYMELAARLYSNPQKLFQSQLDYWHDYLSLMEKTADKLEGKQVEPFVTPDKKDRRFRDEAWHENAVYDFIKQSYLLSAGWLREQVQELDDINEKSQKKMDFYLRQYIDAMSPTNFFMTNPEVVRETIKSNGENLLHGVENLLADLEKSKGLLRVAMTDTKAFEVGRNLAITPGKVVFQNKLMQLIQYAPATDEVYKRPLLIIPPWINKYYILDMRPDNSYVKWCTEQGYTVFVISWVNPDASYRDVGFEDYMEQGPLAALDAIKAAIGEEEVTAIGYCIGGTLLSGMLSYMRAKKDTRIKAATFFTTLLDFSDPGELGLFVEEEQLESLAQHLNEAGYFDGTEMATIFNMLRSNDLIWSFVINNYMMGKAPFPFDLLYWNSDSTRLPAKMHLEYLRNMYVKNLLVKPGGITLGGVKVDISKVDIPAFFLSTREDHIAPWKSTYGGARYLGGDVEFCLSGSGHIAGVINSPEKQKYGYWTNGKLDVSADTWLEKAKQHEGSWWPYWAKWNAKHSGEKVPARDPEKGGLKTIEDAPGSYVKVRV